MEKRIIKSIILEKQKEISQLQLQERLIEFDDRASYVLVGIRRAGKSYQMFQDIKRRVSSGKNKIEDCLYINFEDERISSIAAHELGLIIECYNELFENKYPLIYLDEIQNIEGWEKFARRLVDSHYRVIITGSNAKMLSRDIATTLGGRYIIREIFPFSFDEYLEWNNIKPNKNWEFDTECKIAIKKNFDTYFHFGGFAETFSLTNKREWINSLYLKILLGDIVTRNGIRNGNAIRLLAKKLAESIMQPTTQTRLYNILKSIGNNISRNTISEYLSYMSDAYLIFDVTNFTESFSERATNCKRYYFDNGLLNNFLFDNDAKLLENIVAIELIKRYRQSQNDAVFFYNKGVEVDFFVPDAGLAIQVAYSIEDSLTENREVRALKKISQTFDVSDALIITFDEEKIIEYDGFTVNVVPVWKWLLNDVKV